MFGVHEFFAFAEDAGRNVEAFFHFAEIFGGGVARNLYTINFSVGWLLNWILRFAQDDVCPFGVVREQQQAFARGVEATHGRNVRHHFTGEHLAVLLAEDVHDGGAAFLVACCCHGSARFVHREVEELACGDGRAVHEDFVVLVGGRVGVAHDFTAQRNPALADQVFCDATAAKAAFGNNTGNAMGLFLRGLRSVIPFVVADIVHL